MRLSELLAVPVVDSAGERVGGVADLVLVQDGPLLSERAAALRVAGLVVVRRRHMRLLGYERDLRPAVFRSLVRHLAGEVLRVDWSDVAEVTSDRVLLRVRRADLQQHRRAHRS
jgi:sporulation protein YlmC with PRC-barrel domain